MNLMNDIDVGVAMPLDAGFVPAVLWNRAYRSRLAGAGVPLKIGLVRPDGTSFLYETEILPHSEETKALNIKYVERMVKFLLWQKGGSRVLIGGCDELAAEIAKIYSDDGVRSFDVELIGKKVFLEALTVEACPLEDIPETTSSTVPLGRNLKGCRIGFDLGGSDRKCAAVIDGEVVFSEEIPWSPYFEKDPAFHIDGINDSLKRAAAKLPRVDAIGGSAAGVYVNNEVRVASLFRGVSPADFEEHVRPMFKKLADEWGVPLDVVNDGEVTALAGSMSINDNALLGVSMGTSEAAGYCDEEGHITSWLNELAFAPIDYRDDAPVDEWSGDIGCGVQYFSQQGVARLAPLAGIEFPEEMPLPERLEKVQEMMVAGDESAAAIFHTIGIYFGYAIAHYSEFYEIRNLLVLGRVTSGRGGEIILERAAEVLKVEFPELSEKISLHTPDEKNKRHGQAIAAASLPAVK